MRFKNDVLNENLLFNWLKIIFKILDLDKLIAEIKYKFKEL